MEYLVILASLIVLLFHFTSADCGSPQWQCQNGQCIDTSKRCDSLPDCRDETDEQNCTGTVTCNEGLRKCLFSNGSSHCIDAATPCDCGFPENVLYGTATLDDSTNSSSGASASVTCHDGYETSVPKIICLPTGLWTNSSCTGKECGPVPSISAGDILLVDPKNTTYGANATVKCITGYQASTATISCLASQVWESARCSVIVCGPVANISFGEILLTDRANVSYGATASVKCDNGFLSTKSPISCLATGMWETASCVEKGPTIPVETATPRQDDNTLTILLVLVIPFIVQLIIALCLHCYIRRKNSSKDVKGTPTLWTIVVCAIPYFGLAVIAYVYIWRVYLKYYVNKDTN